MELSQNYPHYHFYDNNKLIPSVLAQKFPLPSLDEDEIYYQLNLKLQKYFTTKLENQKFTAAQFCTFLGDTIEVEHCLVIPAIVSLRRIPYQIPSGPKQDLFKTATDEGYHAEQALAYLTELEDFFGLRGLPNAPPPLFLRRLERQKANQPNKLYRDLITILNGVVTETRISVELGKFAKDHSLSSTVQEICLSHAKDEVVHSSQFQALGQWLWEEFDERTREIASGFLLTSTIARSLPDIDNLVNSFMKATGRSLKDSTQIVLKEYNEDSLIEEMLISTKPTLAFLSKLKIDNFLSFEALVDGERKKIQQEISHRIKNL